VINPSLDWGEDDLAQGPKFRILGLPDDGTYAEQIRVPARNVHAKPAALSFEEAAAIPLAALTAYRAVVSRARVQPGETVLVTGVGGGVSTFAVQIAAHLGARVLVTSGRDAKLARARELGALKFIAATAGTIPADPKEWRLDKKLAGGGSMVDIGIYALQAVRHVSG